jgi:penicillin-binding protein A
MNRALLRLSIACLCMFALLMININFVQAFQSGSLAADPANVRIFNQQFTIQRGAIIADGDGTDVKIAESVKNKNSDTYHRVYPFGREYSAVTGYDTIFGKSGIEQAENRYLTGPTTTLGLHSLVGLLSGNQAGSNVILTISPKAQLAAYQALQAMALTDGGKPAAVVAMNPSTGQILAMASYPSFNPNVLTTQNGTKLDKIDKQLLHAPGNPLLNRAINETYPPGSSFKIVTGATAFATHLVANPSPNVPAPTALPLGNGNFLHNDDFSACANGDPPISVAFYLSCNTAFGRLGMKITAPVLHSYADRFGFNNSGLRIPMPVSPSQWPPVKDNDPAYTALQAIGQYNATVTPIQEAMDASAIANRGVLMKPYLVQSIEASHNLATIYSATPSVFSTPVNSTVASYMRTLMRGVTQNPGGTAYLTAGPPATSIIIAGKTGTAQNGQVSAAGLPPTDDAVFSCFAPAGNGQTPRIAVGVIVQGGGYGADAAAPIAVKIIQAYLGQS